MRSLIVEIPREGARLEFHLSGGVTSGQIVVVIPDGVEIGALPQADQRTQTTAPRKPTSPLREWHSPNGFPPRELTEQAITQVLREHGGRVKIRDESRGSGDRGQVSQSNISRRAPTVASDYPRSGVTL